jgi:AcrR family transcriptional regulator
MAVEAGLRARKKRQTRQQIFEAASRLFAERGFEAVTVADVARAADVSEMTVFNHFPTKEDLFFGGMEFFEERLLAAVEGRAPGESALAAFSRPVLEGCERLAAEETTRVIAAAAAVIGSSPSLQAREREISGRYTGALAALLAGESGVGAGAGGGVGGVEPGAVAAALVGTHRALVAHVRTRVLAGARGPELASEVRAQAELAFGRLARGLDGYGVRNGELPSGLGIQS